MRMPRLLAASLVAIAIALSGCTATQPSASPSVAVGSAHQLAEELDAKQFHDLTQTDGVVILDVRTPEEFADGHIDGAINIDVNSSRFAEEVNKLDQAVTYAIYCRSGNRSQVALDSMKAGGFESLHHLAGGVGAWQAAGFELVKELEPAK